MTQLGTIKALCARYDLHHELLPAHVADLRVVENRRLSRAAGRYCTRSRASVVLDQWIDIHPAVLTLPELYREVLGHEAAHAMTPGANHDYRWARACRALGGPTRTRIPYQLAEAAGMRREFKVVAVCQRCNYELRKARRLNPRKGFYHVKCGGTFAPTKEA
jgi:hypothetical protein